MRPVMYLFANSAVEMSHGKLAAQIAHAAVEAFQISEDRLVNQWYRGGHYTKLVMDGGDAVSLFTIQEYLEERKFRTKLIIDEGRTEISPMTPTALGVEIVDKDESHTAATFESFRTLRPRTGEEVKPNLLRKGFTWLQRLTSSVKRTMVRNHAS